MCPPGTAQEERGACKITRLTHEGGRYVTVEMPPISDHIDSGEEVLSLLSGELAAFLKGEGTVLVVGIGNWDITPGCLGAAVCTQCIGNAPYSGRAWRG